MAKRYEITLEGSVGFHSMIGAKARHGARGLIKPFLTLMKGAQFLRKTGKWNIREKIENRDSDQYFEHIVDAETRALIHHVEETLSKHRGHGSAKYASRRVRGT